MIPSAVLWMHPLNGLESERCVHDMSLFLNYLSSATVVEHTLLQRRKLTDVDNGVFGPPTTACMDDYSGTCAYETMGANEPATREHSPEISITPA